MLLVVGPLIDQVITEQWVLQYAWSQAAAQQLLLSCALAVLVNISQFMCLGRFSAVSFQVSTVCAPTPTAGYTLHVTTNDYDTSMLLFAQFLHTGHLLLTGKPILLSLHAGAGAHQDHFCAVSQLVGIQGADGATENAGHVACCCWYGSLRPGSHATQQRQTKEQTTKGRIRC